MKIRWSSGLLVFLFLLSCSPHIHLDFMGQSQVEEVVLLDSPAKEKILMIDVTGVIGSGDGGLMDKEGDLLSMVHQRLQKARQDARIKSVIIRLDTPGGEVTASDIIYNELREFRDETGIPLVALAMGVAASGGYYIASACDSIIAHPSTLTGSIGVISIFPNFKGLMDKVGVQMTVIKSGEMKDAGSYFRDMTEQDKNYYQTIINGFFQSFLDVVLSGRQGKINRPELEEMADGRVFTARQALELRLIDQIGYMKTAVETACRLAGIPTAKIVAYTYYPGSKTNVYSSLNFNNNNPMEKWIKLLTNLEAGFYYLWLPPGSGGVH